MSEWTCQVCSYVHRAAQPPANCPVCDSLQDRFVGDAEPTAAAAGDRDDGLSGAVRWRCVICGYIHTGPEPPDQCPVCGADRSKFERVAPPGDEPVDDAVKWRCVVCGYIHTGPEPPAQCPVCGADRSKFERVKPPEDHSADAAVPDAADAPAADADARWRCTICNYIHNGPEPPDVCPVCGADRSKFVRPRCVVGLRCGFIGRRLAPLALHDLQLHSHRTGTAGRMPGLRRRPEQVRADR